ncbi:MAG: hypothetical protein Ct9H300mP21_10420 [Pseudomonadota bacterium]|nr:MAG: hypothetical protein Ct9H300mP21_10420 [Pseudomonadota bacterium]
MEEKFIQQLGNFVYLEEYKEFSRTSKKFKLRALLSLTMLAVFNFCLNISIIQAHSTSQQSQNLEIFKT